MAKFWRFSLTRAAGFTMIEMIVVIAITGIIAAVVAVFIRAPVQGYFDTVRRAELTDAADTAVRRMARDLRLALPNSVRVTQAGTTYYLEFLITDGGGRYRAEVDNTGAGDILDFTAADAAFDVIGPSIAFTPGTQRWMAVYNLGIPGADAYASDNISQITGVAGNTVSINAKLFPFASPGHRFQVVEGPVTYECNPAAGTLTRYWGYSIQAAQPTTFAAGSNALLANSVSDCAITYTAQAVAERAGLVSMWLRLTQSGENVNIYHTVHVSNVP